MTPEVTIVATVGGVFAIFVAIIAIIRAMVAPLSKDMVNIQSNMKDAETRARGELDKSEHGLKDQTTRVEGIIRQTVEDVDNKLRREAELIEEKTRIQFQDHQRQIEQLRIIAEQNRIAIWNLRNGVKHEEAGG